MCKTSEKKKKQTFFIPNWISEVLYTATVRWQYNAETKNDQWYYNP
jgi:hypothetical protein